MGRGRRSGEQRNRAATGYELKKKRRSRMGKGINSPEELDPRRRARKVHWRAGTLLVAGEQGRVLVAGERRLVAGGRRAASGCRGVPARCGRAGMRGRASIAARATGMTSCWAGPYPRKLIRRVHQTDTYQHTYPNFAKIKKIGYSSDTYPTRIGHVSVSDTYPIRDTCLPASIRVT